VNAVREHRVVRPIRLAHSRGALLYEARCPCCRTLFGGREDDLSRACPACGTPVEVEIGDRDLSGGIASASYLALDWARRQ
jgi:hypothetical protein